MARVPRVCGIAFKTLQIKDCHFTVFYSNQSIVFEPRKSTRDHVSYRTDAASNLVVGKAHAKCHRTAYGKDSRLRFGKQEECKSLSNLMERQGLHE